jgi:hypothetical protein
MARSRASTSFVLNQACILQAIHVKQEKDGDGYTKVINLGNTKVYQFYEKQKYEFKRNCLP